MLKILYGRTESIGNGDLVDNYEVAEAEDLFDAAAIASRMGLVTRNPLVTPHTSLVYVRSASGEDWTDTVERMARAMLIAARQP